MPGTFSEEYPEEYEYFRGRLALTLGSGELTPEQAAIVGTALADLALRVVARKCGCGAHDCRTFDFEHRGGDGANPYLDLVGLPEIILFHNKDGEMNSLEQYPQS